VRKRQLALFHAEAKLPRSWRRIPVRRVPFEFTVSLIRRDPADLSP
jgi:hypothetical protein